MSITQYGYGDIQTCGPCTGHPNDPRTDELPQHVINEMFDAEVQKKLEFINDNVNGEFSKEGTSHGVTDKVLPVFGSVLAGLSDEDVRHLLAVYSWSDDETTQTALNVLKKIAASACLNLAEAQVECEWGSI